MRSISKSSVSTPPRGARRSNNQQAYTMVPATAVLVVDDHEGISPQAHQGSYRGGTTSKHGDTSLATAHVLEVVRDEQALPPSTSTTTTMQGVGGGGTNDDEDSTYVKGVVLEPSYTDVGFAAAFMVTVLVTVASALFLGIPAVITSLDHKNATAASGDSTNVAAPSSSDDRFLPWFLGLLLAGLLWSFGILRVLLWGARTSPTQFVRIAYLSVPALIVVSCAPVVYAPIALIWAICLLVAWRRLRPSMSFASATLRVSAIAVQENSWVLVVSLGSALVLSAWFMLWVLAYRGLMDRLDKSNADGPIATLLVIGMYAFVLSLFWGQNVIKNVVHFTTSGAVSTWWFMPPPEHDGPGAVKDSLYRATTYSLGSVCMASLFIAFAEFAEAVARSSSRRGLFMCIIVCLLRCVREWLEYFTSFALVYAALYNSDCWTAGKQVTQLFRHVGWKTFIGDALIFRVLFMCKVAAASLTGLSSVLCYAALGSHPTSTADNAAAAAAADDDDDDENSYGNILAMMYLLGFVIGYIASSPVLFALESAVRTVMVCLAEHPYPFLEAHPELFELLTAGWSEAYPYSWQRQKAVAVAVPMQERVVV